MSDPSLGRSILLTCLLWLLLRLFTMYVVCYCVVIVFCVFLGKSCGWPKNARFAGFVRVAWRNGNSARHFKNMKTSRIACLRRRPATAVCQMPERGRTHSRMNASCDVAHGAHYHHRDVSPVLLCAKVWCRFLTILWPMRVLFFFRLVDCNKINFVSWLCYFLLYWPLIYDTTFYVAS